VRLRGIGRFSLRPVELLLRPAEPDDGITINGVPVVAANAVVYRHTMRVGKVRMVEHLLSACRGLGISDLAVEVRGEELPFLDGSSLGCVRALERAGLKVQGRAPEALTLRSPVMVLAGTSFIAAVPATGLTLNCLARVPGRGVQFFSHRAGSAGYRTQVAPARTFGRAAGTPRRVQSSLRLTFGLVREADMLYPARSRFANEPCRHKVLDLLGDLALLGRNLEAEVFAYCPGHRLNLEFVRSLERST